MPGSLDGCQSIQAIHLTLNRACCELSCMHGSRSVRMQVICTKYESNIKPFQYLLEDWLCPLVHSAALFVVLLQYRGSFLPLLFWLW